MERSKFKLTLILIFLFSVTTFGQLPKIVHNSFKKGEHLEYRLHYGLINAGKATLDITKHPNLINGREVYHMVGTGKSNRAFDLFFKVRDRYETYMDVDGSFPWLFKRDINEGGYKKKQKYLFYQNKNKVKTSDGETYNVTQGVQDMLSSFYYARTIDYSNAKEGEVFTIPSFVDEESWELKIRFVGKETIKVGGKKYRAMKFHPVIQTGRLFKNEEDVSVWISDDGNKIPLLASAKVLIGSIKMEITDYSGLSNPISLVKK